MRANRSIGAWLGALWAVASGPGLAQGADLLEIYQRALQNDPQVREADATRLAVRETKPQALSALLPQLSVSGQLTKSESDGTNVFLQQDTTTGNITALSVQSHSEGDSTNVMAQLQQSLFRWEDWANLRRSDKQVAQAEADYLAAQQDLILRVSQRYFGVLAAQNDLEAQQSALEATARQLEQADKRFEVGLIAITDVQEAKAARDAGLAAVIAAKRALATSEELLREVAGDAPSSPLARPAETMPLQTPAPQNAEQWVAAAMEQNPRLISSRLGADIARQDIRVARGGHFPSLSLSASRTKLDLEADQDTGSGTFPADRDSTDDQVALVLNFPIFSGGLTSSRVRQAVYLHRAAKERLERTVRETERGTRDAYLGIVSEISRVEALRQSLESSRTALEATEAGYEVGTRTAVDVLNARRTLAQAQSDYARSRYDYLLNLIQLKLEAGSLSLQDVEQINGWLQPPAPPAPPANETAPAVPPPPPAQ